MSPVGPSTPIKWTVVRTFTEGQLVVRVNRGDKQGSYLPKFSVSVGKPRTEKECVVEGSLTWNLPLYATEDGLDVVTIDAVVIKLLHLAQDFVREEYRRASLKYLNAG
jgi:hypothetical protein